MDNQIAILIALYEEEKNRLETLIKECLEDFEGPNYLLADYHQRAMFQVMHTLRILKCYDDSLFEEKESISRSISWLEKEFEKNKSEYLKEHLREAKAKLEKLTSIPKKTSIEQEGHIFENALSDLINKRRKKFKLILNNSKNFYLEFSSSRNIIKIVVPNVKLHIKNYTLYESNLTGFQKIGFKVVNENKLGVSFINEGEKTIEEIKFLLVKVLFKVLHYKSYQNESYIEFQE